MLIDVDVDREVLAGIEALHRGDDIGDRGRHRRNDAGTEREAAARARAIW